MDNDVIDYVSGADGDWEAVYVNGKVYAQNHSIDVHHWLSLIEEVGYQYFHDLEVHKWELDFAANELSWAPTDFSEIADLVTEP